MFFTARRPAGICGPCIANLFLFQGEIFSPLFHSECMRNRMSFLAWVALGEQSPHHFAMLSKHLLGQGLFRSMGVIS